MQKYCNIFDSYRLSRTVSVEDLASQITDYVVSDLGSLSLNHEPYELGQVGGQVILVVEELDDLCVVMTLQELDLASILLHA